MSDSEETSYVSREDVRSVPEEILPNELHEGDEDAKGDELAGEDVDDSWLDEPDVEGEADE